MYPLEEHLFGSLKHRGLLCLSIAVLKTKTAPKLCGVNNLLLFLIVLWVDWAQLVSHLGILTQLQTGIRCSCS